MAEIDDFVATVSENIDLPTPWQQEMLDSIIKNGPQTIVLTGRQSGKSYFNQQHINQMHKIHKEQIEAETRQRISDDPLYAERKILWEIFRDPHTSIHSAYKEYEPHLRSLNDRNIMCVYNIHDINKKRIRFNAFITSKGVDYFNSLKDYDGL